jgi:hypothetical protein
MVASALRTRLTQETVRGPLTWLVGLVAILLTVALGIALGAAILNGVVPGLTAPEWRVAQITIAAVALLIALAVALTSVLGDAYAGALWLVSPRIPGVAALAVVLAYLLPGGGPANGGIAVALGTYAAVLSWLLLAIAFRYMARSNSAHPRPYGELMERIEELSDRACRLPPSGESGESGEMKDIQKQLDRARDVLYEPGTDDPGKPRTPRAGKDWAAGTGYFVAWRAVHAAEEALLECGSANMAIGEALHDDLRLANSTIENADVLRRSLRNAVVELDEEAIGRYFPNVEGLPDAKPRRKRPTAASSGVEAGAKQARATLREIRHAINEFRDAARDSLAQSRNRLLQTILVAGIVAYILLATAIINGVEPVILQSAVVFFLVGALVGLFNRLRIEASTNRAIDDFGLFEARLLHTPLISGLAGVGGVFLVAIAPLASGAMAPGQPLNMADVFDVSHNQVGLLVAAVFGLTPSSIIGSLQKQTDRTKRDLASSSAVAAEGQGAKPPS